MRYFANESLMHKVRIKADKVFSRRRSRRNGRYTTRRYAYMLVFAAAVSHSPAKETMSSPLLSWLKKCGWPE